ncbi:MAG TPA: amino acid adenylation domain-containing protein [Bryobacteraceae bacterium]|nr:amino acid adenylation domain-containing protein [Bryobacteraceae bacterium]
MKHETFAGIPAGSDMGTVEKAISEQADRCHVLSSAQRRMWLLHEMNPESCVYNTAAGVLVRGSVDPSALNRALQAVTMRHGSLRTTFRQPGGGPCQLVAAAANSSLQYVSAEEVGESIEDFVREQIHQPFDLERGPLFRPYLIQSGKDHCAFVTVLHHILGDEWSKGIFLRDLFAAYAAIKSRQEPFTGEAAPVQYVDYARWEQARLSGPWRDPQAAFWKRELEGTTGILNLPLDFVRPREIGPEGAREHVTFDEGECARLQQLARHEKTTLFVTLSALWQVLLYRYTGAHDVIVATPIANRLSADLAGMFGYVSNLIPLRANISGAMTFRGFLRAHHRNCMAAFGHAELPFEEIISEISVERDAAFQPLAQVMFSFQHGDPGLTQVAGLEMESLEFDGGMTTFDLVLWIRQQGKLLDGWIKYRRDIFLPETIQGMSRACARTISTLVSNPDMRICDLVLMDAKDCPTAQYGAAKKVNPPMLLPARIQAWAKLRPDQIAVTDGISAMSYSKLNAKASRLAQRIRSHGATTDSIVGICIDDPIARIVATVSVLYSGAAFLPLDAGLPDRRLRRMLEDAGAKLILGNVSRDLRLNDVAPTVLVDGPDDAEILAALTTVTLHPDSLAYVIYTSGSTGTPKGVLITHRGLAHFTEHQEKFFAPEPGDGVLQFASPSFDASVSEIVLALGHGATLHVYRRDKLLAGDPLKEILSQPQITLALLTPSALATIQPAKYNLRHLIAGAEACPEELARAWANHVSFFNAYGPTEITVYGTLAELPPKFDRLTIGRPLAYTEAYIVDENFQLAPIGVTGEILIGGEGLARGYLNSSILTAERFVPDPFGRKPGQRLYRTGDLGRWLADGRIEHAGRNDQQLKIRGHRVEPAEIEAVIATNRNVAECAVIGRPSRDGSKELVAYIRPGRDGGPDIHELRSVLRDQLPDYLVPAVFCVIEDFPRTGTGKLDRQRLASLEVKRAVTSESYVRPQSRFEETVSRVWGELFDIDQVSLDANFFDLGGNSLLIIRAQHRLEEIFGKKIPIIEMFRNPTVLTLGAYLGGEHSNGKPPSGGANSEPGSRRLARREIVRKNLENRRTAH